MPVAGSHEAFQLPSKRCARRPVELSSIFISDTEVCKRPAPKRLKISSTTATPHVAPLANEQSISAPENQQTQLRQLCARMCDASCQFEVVVDCRKRSLGLAVEKEQNGDNLVIVGVDEEGAVNAWNRRGDVEGKVTFKVQQGDSIVAANGAKGDADQLLQQFHSPDNREWFSMIVRKIRPGEAQTSMHTKLKWVGSGVPRYPQAEDDMQLERYHVVPVTRDPGRWLPLAPIADCPKEPAGIERFRSVQSPTFPESPLHGSSGVSSKVQPILASTQWTSVSLGSTAGQFMLPSRVLVTLPCRRRICKDPQEDSEKEQPIMAPENQRTQLRQLCAKICDKDLEELHQSSGDMRAHCEEYKRQNGNPCVN
eukprot:gnl/MRDRNA2_/MRDRNA2_64653_c0_seq1.p1 gnl/MRDRNA2_/MRDRNA2_64653_c0~~gnl/MRDRNA2_/MRDRNA2_64653_c0_seq1.p1  ORF type:complete len:368 (+),score=55.63 gnl/MRDRNA2_/MRDRNA2_64653_c0_seq1:73-1176(+)